MRGGVDLKKQLQQSMELGKKMKETAGMEWKEGDRCKRVGKKGAAAGVKEEKKGGRRGEGFSAGVTMFIASTAALQQPTPMFQ